MEAHDLFRMDQTSKDSDTDDEYRAEMGRQSDLPNYIDEEDDERKRLLKGVEVRYDIENKEMRMFVKDSDSDTDDAERPSIGETENHVMITATKSDLEAKSAVEDNKRRLILKYSDSDEEKKMIIMESDSESKQNSAIEKDERRMILKDSDESARQAGQENVQSSNLDNYYCTICNTSFSHERCLSNHIRFNHGTKLELLLNRNLAKTGNPSQWQCDLCQDGLCAQWLEPPQSTLKHGDTENGRTPQKKKNAKTLDQTIGLDSSELDDNTKDNFVEGNTILKVSTSIFSGSKRKMKHKLGTLNKEYERSMKSNCYGSDNAFNVNSDHSSLCDVSGDGFSVNSGYLPISEESGDTFIINSDHSPHGDASSDAFNVSSDTFNVSSDAFNVSSDTFNVSSDLSSNCVDESSIIHTGDRPFKCHICGRGFGYEANLQTHIRAHAGDKPHICHLCGKEFKKNKYLKAHIKVHINDRRHVCDLCGKSFRVNADLTKHMRIHTGDKPYQCQLCEKAFSLLHHLKNHTRTHTGEKPYKCDVCGKEFIDSSTLRRHTRIHTGEKPYTCEICDRKFSLRHSLQGHIKTHKEHQG